MSDTQITYYTDLAEAIGSLQSMEIPADRKAMLKVLIDYIYEQVSGGSKVQLNFICTHNSRRSQFSQVWAQTAADHFGIETGCYSGGVEITAFNPRAVAALERTGFHISKEGDENPVYDVKYSDDASPVFAFSKLFNDELNPAEGFAAVMTCSDADKNCPFILGADRRIPVTYEDPKAFDGTDREVAMYDERCRQIGAEMFYVFSMVKEKL